MTIATYPIAVMPPMTVLIIALFVIDMLGNGFLRVRTDAVEVGTGDAGVGTTASAEGDGGKHGCRNQALFH